VPDITVCIPAYNAEARLEESIRSVADQVVEAEVEILVCDDGSTDGTGAVLLDLQREYPNIRILTNEVNRGRPHTRNRLLDEARGRFLTWHDADDVKYPGMLAAQLDHLRQLEGEGGAEAIRGVVVYTNFHRWWSHADAPVLVTPEEPLDAMEALLSARFDAYLWLTMGLTQTYRAAGPFDEKMPRLQDLAYFLRFAELGGRFVHVGSDEPFCVYHKDDSGRGSNDVWKSWCRIWRLNRHHFKSYGLINARRWRRHHYKVARRFAKANGDVLVWRKVALLEALYMIRGRLRRVIFDA
jgi:glycosyltransferase involved in cell wall biosynthesis